MVTLTDVLNALEQLTEEDQEAFADIIRQRQIERRRDEIAHNAKEAIAAYRAGLLPSYTAEEAIAHLEMVLETPDEP
jgi:hypothetical protein